MSKEIRFGFVALLGRPNVGKSTLLNQLIGKKISITSHRPQTTRHRILGIVNEPNRQIVFVDTPGVHAVSKKTQRKRMNKVINRTAVASLEGIDLVLFIITADGWRDEDEIPLRALKESNAPVVVLINKLDKLNSKNDVLPIIDSINHRLDCDAVIPVSALKGDNCDYLLDYVTEKLPLEIPGFDKNQTTDRSQNFLMSEMIREQLFQLLGDELPYATAVELQQVVIEGKTYHISADIWVEKVNHKGIVMANRVLN